MEFEEDTLTIRKVWSLLEQAAEGDTDVVELFPHGGRVRICDREGNKSYLDPIPSHEYRSVVSRLEIMSGMDITKKEEEQSGKILQKVKGVPYEFDVSTSPGSKGEGKYLKLSATVDRQT